MSPTDLEEFDKRLRLLEALAHNFSGDEAERLAVGVERLADETGGLNAILSKVDDATRRVGAMERKVDEKASKKDLTSTAEAVEEFRMRALRRIYGSTVVFSLLFFVALGLFLEYQSAQDSQTRDACLNRNAQNAAIIDILRGASANSPVTPSLQEGIAKFEGLVQEC